jgi:hypothetical protein
MRNEIECWERVHHIDGAAIRLAVVKSPLDSDWILQADGWTFPAHAVLLHPSLEAAQRAADDFLLAYQIHDCKQRGCADWMPSQSRVLVFDRDDWSGSVS